MPLDPRPDFTPDWETCRVAENCRGVRYGDTNQCLVHNYAGLDKVLDSFGPETDLDLRGIELSPAHLTRILARFDDGDRIRLGNARFDRAWFTGDVDIGTVFVDGDAWFDGACFPGARLRISVAGDAHFVGARFEERAVLEIDAARTGLSEAQFAKGVTLRLLSGAVDATRTVFGEPASIIGHQDGRSPAEVISLRGVDVRGLVLTDVELGRCVFDGAHGLDQLRLEGNCPFGQSRPRWWSTRRQLLAGELAWRGEGNSLPPDEPVGPARLAGQYRSLRKSFEDNKNEAGAGDFYYGEMEMRRHSPETSRAEKVILWVYWLFSGYGQRASRALAALFVVVVTVTALLTLWGTDFGMAARISVGAVVFRDDKTELTAAGEWTVLVARFLGPVLLALAVLAVRARVKR